MLPRSARGRQRSGRLFESPRLFRLAPRLDIVLHRSPCPRASTTWFGLPCRVASHDLQPARHRSSVRRGGRRARPACNDRQPQNAQRSSPGACLGTPCPHDAPNHLPVSGRRSSKPKGLPGCGTVAVAAVQAHIGLLPGPYSTLRGPVRHDAGYAQSRDPAPRARPTPDWHRPPSTS